MDTIHAIFTRRSIRKYAPATIPKDIIETWINCGMHAPSAGNEQAWHFLVIDDQVILKQIPTFHHHADMIANASLGILICIDSTLEKHSSMAIQDCSAATQNILLAVHESGFGAVWLGVYPRQKRIDGLRTLLNIPESIIPFSLISIGKPNETKMTPDRFKKDRIHHNKW